jgi:hypothetical protein
MLPDDQEQGNAVRFNPNTIMCILSKSSEKNVKKLALIAAFFVLSVFASMAHAQQIDAGFSFGTLLSGQGKTVNGLLFPTVGGGLYPGFNADFLLRRHFGLEGDISWRASQNLYGGGQPFRPIFYSFDAIWAPPITKNISAEVLAGIGAENVRFYTNGFNCSSFTGCTNYNTTTHFMGDFGGGIRAYFWRDAFIRPEVRLYLINNNVEFSSGYATRVGATIGYSFGRR